MDRLLTSVRRLECIFRDKYIRK